MGKPKGMAEWNAAKSTAEKGRPSLLYRVEALARGDMARMRVETAAGRSKRGIALDVPALDPGRQDRGRRIDRSDGLCVVPLGGFGLRAPSMRVQCPPTRALKQGQVVSDCMTDGPAPGAFKRTRPFRWA